MANSTIFNVFTGTLDYVGAADPNFVDPVATEALLPATANDGALCVVQATQDIYEYSTTLGKWLNTTHVFIDTLGSTPSASGTVQTTTTNTNNVQEKHIALQPADATHPGLVTTAAQTFAGTKTFSGILTPTIDGVSGGPTLNVGTGSTLLNLGTSGNSITHLQSNNIFFDGITPSTLLFTTGGGNLSGLTMTTGQIVGGWTGSNPTALTLQGTTNQISASFDPVTTKTITLSLPQNIATTSSPTFSAVYAGSLDTASAGTLGIGYGNASVINIGHSGAIVNILGTTNTVNVTNYNVANKVINLNTSGPSGSASGVGLQIDENSLVTASILTSGDRNSWQLIAPNTAGIVTITPGASGFTLNQGSHNPLSLSTTGLGISLDAANQILSAQYATTSQPGLLSSTDWTTFNNKIGGTGTTGYNAYFSSANVIAGEQYVSAARGGLATNASAFTGVLKAAAGVFSAATIVNADVSSTAAIAYSKLNLTGSILNADLAGSIAASKLVGTDIATVGTITAGTWQGSIIQPAYIATLNQNTTGTAANITATSNSTLTTLTALSLPTSQLSGQVAIANGGTGTASTSQAFAFIGPVSGSGAPSFRALVATDIPTLNQNTTGTASNITATSNSTLTTLTALSLPGSQVSGNISGNAANITGTTNNTLTTLSALSLPYSQITGSPTITGDILTTSFAGANNQAAAANVTGALFTGTVTRAFQMQVSVMVAATTSLAEEFVLNGAYNGTAWNMSYQSTGDISGVVFTITAAGQLQYQSLSYTGFTSLTIKFRATTTPV